jgi:hypothetical protein
MRNFLNQIDATFQRAMVLALVVAVFLVLGGLSVKAQGETGSKLLEMYCMKAEVTKNFMAHKNASVIARAATSGRTDGIRLVIFRELNGRYHVSLADPERNVFCMIANGDEIEILKNPIPVASKNDNKS